MKDTLNNIIKIALIQNSFVENIEDNREKCIEKIREAGKSRADLIVLSELNNSLYFCQREDTRFFDLAETIPGPSTQIYGKIAKELNIVLIISLFEKRTAGIYHNTAAVIERDGSLAGIYRKMHIPDDPGYYEKFYFTPGDSGFKPVNTSVGRLGIQVCWDQWFPEAARIMAINGAEILIYPTAIGWEVRDSEDEKKKQLDSWVTIQRSHAIANGIPVVCVNRVGFEGGQTGGQTAFNDGGINFWGNSFAAGCQGEFLAMASNEKEEILIVDIDKKQTERVRRIWPFFRDRRIDSYKEINERYTG